MRYLSESINNLDLVDAVDARTEAAMYAEYLVVNDNAEGEVVEHVGEVVPDIGVAVFARAFCVEAVGLGYAAGFVVSAD